MFRSCVARSMAALIATAPAPAVVAQSLLVPMHDFTPNQGFAQSAALAFGVGDLDGDGCDDFCAEAMLAFPNPFAAIAGLQMRSGRTGLVLPNLLTNQSWISLGSTTALPKTVVAGGDVNGDGFPDFLGGRSFYAALPSPVFVISGEHLHSAYAGLVPATPPLLVTLMPPAGAVDFGMESIAFLGDVNADGNDDFAVTDLAAGAASGIHVYAGGTWSLLATLTSATDPNFGATAAAFRDSNSDGFGDFLVTVPAPNSAAPGRVDLVSGEWVTATAAGTTPTTSRVLASIAGVGFGIGLATLGDTDGDGITDFAIAAETPAFFSSDDLYIYSGSTLALRYQIVGSSLGNFTPRHLAGPGDTNGDGFADVLVGGLGASSSGAWCLSGPNGDVLHHWYESAPAAHLGSPLAGVGDANGDGLADVIFFGRGGTSGGCSFLGCTPVVTTPPKVVVSAVGGASRYGTTLSSAPLQLSWQPSVSGLAAGSVRLAGAAPFATGALGASLARAATSGLGVAVLIDLVNSTDVIFALAFDGNGEWSFPYSLRAPHFDEVSFFIQGFELSPALRESNGLELRLTN